MKSTLKLGLIGLTTSLLLTQCKPEKTEEVMETANPKTPSLTKLWETLETLETVESVLYDEATGTIYTSNIFGQNPLEKDGNGTISIIGKDGSIITQDWISGLNAPKGMGISNGHLYVTDIDELVEIDLASAEITRKFQVEGAEFLNDVAIYDGEIYFTDMNTGKVHLLEDGTISTMSEGHDSINGIAITKDGGIYALDASGLIKWNPDGSTSIVNDQVTGGDGLVILGDNNFVASRWIGEIWFISKDGQTLMLDTKAEKSNTADIGYNPEEMTVYVPTFYKNKVVAYKLDY